MGGFAEKNGRAGSPLPAASLVETAWPMVRLGDVCEFRRGLTYKKSDEVEVSSNVVLRSNNISLESGEFDFSELKYLNESLDIPCDKRVVPGAILMCMANGSKQHLGKVALVDRDLGYAFGGFMGLIIPRGVDSKFVYLMLVSPAFKAHLECLQDGANINNLKFSDIDQFEFPLPPLSVQCEIVERLEKELGEAEKVAAGFRRIAEKAEAEFKAELDETFKVLEDDVSRGGSETRSVRLGDVCDFMRRGKSPTYCDRSPYPMFAQKCNQPSHITLDKCKFCEPDKFLKFGEEYRLREDDIVVNSTGTGTLGRVGLFKLDYLKPYGYETIVADSHVMIVRTSYKMNSVFLYWYMRQSWVYQWINDNANGSTNQKELYPQTLGELPVPLPTLSAQHVIVSCLDAARERCDKIKAEAEKGLKAAENLRKAILKEAFEQ